MWKLHNGYMTPPISSMFKKSIRNNNRYQLPFPRLDIAKRQIAYSCVTLWNMEIPESNENNIKSISTRKGFANKYKAYLFKSLQ